MRIDTESLAILCCSTNVCTCIQRRKDEIKNQLL